MESSTQQHAIETETLEGKGATSSVETSRGGTLATRPAPERGVPDARKQHVDVRGTRIPALGFGTWQLSDVEAAEGVRDALALGYRHIDTAAAYENHGGVGRGIRESGVLRDEIFLASKIWWEDAAADDVRRAGHDMVRELGVDHVDLAYLHWPNDEVPLRETLEAMKELMEEGLFRRLGVSNFPVEMLAEALAIAPITAVQVEYHPFLAQDDLRAYCQRHEVALVAYSPLARGEVLENETLREIADEHHATAAQVALRWLTQQKNVVAIPKASTHAHRQANLVALDLQLDATEANRIAELACDMRLIDPDFAPEW